MTASKMSRNNSNQRAKDLYNKTIKSLKKETEEDTKKWKKKLPYPCIFRINIVKMTIFKEQFTYSM